MRRILALLFVLVVTPALVSGETKQESKKRPSREYTIEQFMATTSVGGASFSSDEKSILFSSNESGIFNVYAVPVTGGKAKALTFSTTDSTFAVSFFPHDDRFLYMRDQGGNENDHLYVMQDGKELDLTPGDKLKARFAGWTKDGKAFYVATNERDPRFFDLYRYDAKSYEREMIYRDEVGYQLGAISDDGRWLAFEKPKTTNDSDIFVWDIEKKTMKHISPHEGEASYSPASFDPSSRHLFFLTNDGGEFTSVRRYALTSGKVENVESADWDILYTSFSENGKYRVTGINADGQTVIRLYDAKKGTPVALPKMPGGEITSLRIARSESKMAFYVNGSRSPNNLYVYDFETKKTTRLTDTLSREIDPEDLVESEVVRFESFDGMVIPSIFYKPHQASPANKVPAVIYVHGGPGGQTRKGYNAQIQFLVNHGYAVLGINNRGSSGYGKSFLAADDRKHGREPLWDCVEAKKYLASLPYIDGSRIAIMGGSYGGYMVLAALAFQPEVFDVGVNIFGVSNWIRTLESIPPYWESFRKALYAEMGDPVKDREMLEAVSPLLHADRIRRPLLVLQGANDPRVIKPESDDIVAAVKKNGVPVEYVVFDDEGHGFTKKKNQIAGYSAVLEFLDTHLKGKKSAAAEGQQ